MTTNGIYLKPATSSARETIDMMLASLVEQFLDADADRRDAIEEAAITTLMAVLHADATPAHEAWEFALAEAGR